MGVIYEPKGRAAEYADLACNLYLTCSHGCRYCYVPQTIRANPNAFFSAGEYRSGIATRLQEDARMIRLFGDDRSVLFCFACDPFQNLEDGIAEEALSIMRSNRVSFITLTKSGSRALDLIHYYSERDTFAASLTFSSDEKSRQWEPNAALPSDRIEGLELAKQAGIKTWASIEPVIDANESLEIIERSAPWVDHFKIGAVSQRDLQARVNWDDFARQAISLVRKLGKTWLIKNELMKLGSVDPRDKQG